MTRQDVIEKSTAYNRAVTRYGWPCIVVSLSAMVAWMLNHSERTDLNLLLLVLIGAPIVAFLIPISRVQKRLHLECPHCQLLLFKHKIMQIVLTTGKCPKCKERIIDD